MFLDGCFDSVLDWVSCKRNVALGDLAHISRGSCAGQTLQQRRSCSAIWRLETLLLCVPSHIAFASFCTQIVEGAIRSQAYWML